MIYLPSKPVVILGAARTPQAPLGGSLERFKATQLGAIAIAGALKRAAVPAEAVGECLMGNVVSAGLMQAPAKQAAVGAGIPHECCCQTINTVCASGMSAVKDACLSLCEGFSKVVVAGGMESRSTAPYYLGPFDDKEERLPGKVRGFELRIRSPGRNATVEEHVDFLKRLKLAGIHEASIYDSLMCPFSDGLSMKDYAVRYAAAAGLNVEETNAAAAESYRRARAARDSGDFAREIVPAGDVSLDDIISPEREADFRAFSYDHVTAYNAPQLADGAAALVLALEETARNMDIEPLGRIVAVARIDTEPADFVHAPIDALREMEAAVGAHPAIIEVNESFGLQDPLFRREYPTDEMNPYGGSVALGHPVGASGARVVVTLLNAMADRQHTYGAATICFGSGGAMAIGVEVT